jgi:hypothetical protein
LSKRLNVSNAIRPDISEERKVNALAGPIVKPPSTAKYATAMKKREEKEKEEARNIEKLKEEEDKRKQRLKEVIT